MTSLPAVPLTLEGASVLHQMMRFRWTAWKALTSAQRDAALEEAAATLRAMQQTVVYSLIGHKGDLMFLHFRKTFEELSQAEIAMARLRLSEFLEPTTSYLSMVELGLYESTIKLYGSLAAVSSRIPRSGTRRSKRSSRASGRLWRSAYGRPFRIASTSASIPWTAAAAKA